MTTDNPPAIQLVDYMGDLDDYHELNLIGPYASATERDTDLARLKGLPLGEPQYNGGYQFLAATMAGCSAAHVVEPEQVARVGTISEFYAAFHGWDE